MSAIVRHNPSSSEKRQVPQPAPTESLSVHRTLVETDRASARKPSKSNDERGPITLEPHWAAAIDVATD